MTSSKCIARGFVGDYGNRLVGEFTFAPRKVHALDSFQNPEIKATDEIKYSFKTAKTPQEAICRAF